MRIPILRNVILSAIIAAGSVSPTLADDGTWLPSLVTPTPQAGFALAVKLSRMGVKTTQPDVAVLKRERKEYAEDAEDLIAASHVIATHFQTIAAANDYWK
jgi:hypothetical protein